ncbi:MAG: type IV pilus assembly protein PilM [Acidobacteria bacterium]|nr:type IV pilus assembly protein PilM [Acidobacteriota bacterium]
MVGLDIGSSAVKAIELKKSGRGFKVTAIGVEPVPPDSIVDGAIMDAGAVTDAVRRLLQSPRFKAKDVVASLSGSSVIVKKINLPVMSEADLADSIQWEAEQYIPFDIQDVNLDYQILTPVAERQGTMDVLLVAAKKDKIADYTGIVSAVGKKAVVVDVDAFALQNAFETNYADDVGKIVALINAGASAININLVSGGTSLFTRDVGIGGNAFTEAVQKELGLPFEGAEDAKRGLPVDGVRSDDVRPVLHAVMENVLLEIEKTFDFFKATSASDHIDRIIVSGGASMVEEFETALRERLGTEVERFDPFRNVPIDPAALQGGSAADYAPVCAVAMGLALRKDGDR